MKTLRLASPAAAAASALLGCACSTCAVGGSLAIRPPSAGATSGRLRGLWTKVGAASSSSSSSSITRRSRRRFGARLPEVEPWPAKRPRLLLLAPLLLGMTPWPSVSCWPPYHQWSAAVDCHLRRCWCTDNTEQRCPLVGPLLSGAPCWVPVKHTQSPGQCLRCTKQRRKVVRRRV